MKTLLFMNCNLCNNQSFSEYAKKGEYQLYQCSACSFVFVYPTPSDLAGIYGESYFNKPDDQEYGYVDYDRDKEPLRKLFIRYIEKFESLTSGRRILDVGAATGYFLDLAKARGWQTFGTEISDYAAKEAQSRGHKMIVAPLTEITGEKYDVITMWDVLEHVSNPVEYVRAAKNLLSDNGVLAINTVDTSSLWARMMKGKWHLVVPPEHISFLSKQNLRELLEREGYEVLSIKKPSKLFSLPYIFNTLYHWQGLGIWRHFARFTDRPLFRWIFLPTNLMDNIFVIARKK